MNSYNRIAATLYSLMTFCLRNTGINTLHKGDDDDDDDNNNNNNNNNNMDFIYIFSPYHVVNTSNLGYIIRPLNAV